MLKKPKAPFYIFRHYETVQIYHFSFFFGNFLMSPKGPPSIFLIFCNKLYFIKAQRFPPFTIFDFVRFFKMIIFSSKKCFFYFLKLFLLFKNFLVFKNLKGPHPLDYFRHCATFFPKFFLMSPKGSVGTLVPGHTNFF